MAFFLKPKKNMATAMRVPTIFTAVDRFSHVVDRMSKSASAFGATAQASAMRTSRALSSAGTSMLTAGASIGVGLGLAVNEAVKFEKSISNISTLTENTPAEMKFIGDSILNMAKKIPIELSDLTTSMYDVVSAGITGTANQLEVLNRSGRLAVAGLGTTKEAVDITTSALNAFGAEAGTAYDVTNKLMWSVKHGKTTVSGIAESFGKSAAIMKNANVTLDDYLASSATLTTAGMTMSQAQTQMTSAVVAMLKPNSQMKKIFKDLGVKDVPKFIKENGKLSNSFDKIVDSGKKIGVTMETAFGRKEGLSAQLSLGGAMRDKYSQVYGDIKSGKDIIDSAFAKQMATTASRFQLMKNNVIVLAIRIGDVLLPALTSLLDYTIPIVEKITDWVKNNKRLVKAVFFLTVGLLLLGFATKAAAFYLTGYASALKIIAFATEAYTGILWFLSLSFEGMAVATTYATAALWSFLWPLGLFALSIWVIIDMVQHWEDWYEIILLCVGPLGWVLLLLGKIIKHSDNIRNKFAFEGWSGGIKAIGIMLEDLILSPLIGIFNILGRLTSFIPGVGSTFTELAADLDASRHKIAPELTVGNLNGASQFTNFGGITPQWDLNKKDNLAGMNGDVTQQMMAMLAKGVIDINLNAPPGVIDGVDKSQSTGVRVNLGSTIGQRGNQNGY